MIVEINTSLNEKLERSFYERPDVVEVARDLIGTHLVSNIDNQITVGMIVETEAYCGRGDKACHANYRKTPRTEVMYGRGAHGYIYLCYGIHHLFNVVTNTEGMADAVLIRAIEPIEGLETMKLRRGNPKTRLTAGPGILSQAMGIKVNRSGIDLLADEIWISPRKRNDFKIEIDTRIGVDYAEEDALKPWRFYMEGNKNVSKTKRARGE